MKYYPKNLVEWNNCCIFVKESSLKYWGCYGIDCNVNGSTTRGEKCQFSLNLHKTITDEMSTMTFEDLMAFVGADLAVAQSAIRWLLMDIKKE